MTHEEDKQIRMARLLQSGSDSPELDELSLSPAERELFLKAKEGLKAIQNVQKKSASDTARGAGLDETLPLPNPQQVRNIGRFQTIRDLGTGGHGTVLLVFDPHLDRQVALKVPNITALSNEESRQRFIRESKAAAILSHPAIVPVFESGHVGPVSYIVYKYIPGISLASWLKTNSLMNHPLMAAEVIEQLAEAIEHAHQRGVIHRDLKPANILLEEPFDAQSPNASLAKVVRIADFGLAKMDVDAQSLTHDNQVVGTPAYMSPEQAEGNSTITSSADIYALGVILYELLTGKPPHRKENVVATLRAVTSDSVKSPRSFNPKIPRELEAICLKCLERKPEDRYTSAFLLAKDLRAAIEHQPVSVTPPTTLQRLEKWCRRNPILVRAGFTTLFISVLVLTVALLWVNHARNAESAARMLAASNLERAKAIVSDFFITTEKEIAGLPGDSPLRKTLAQKSIGYLSELELLAEKRDRLALEQIASCRVRLASILRDSHMFNASESHYLKAQEEYDRLLFDGDSFEQSAGGERRLEYEMNRASIARLLGHLHLYWGKLDTSLTFNETAINSLMTLNSSHSNQKLVDELLSALVDRSAVYNLMESPNQALDVQIRAVKLLESEHNETGLTESRLMLEMGFTQSILEQHQKAAEYYRSGLREVERLTEESGDQRGMQTLRIRLNSLLGYALTCQGQDEGDLKSAEQNRRDIQILADENPTIAYFQEDLALAIADVATCQFRRNQWELAAPSFRQAIETIERMQAKSKKARPMRSKLLGSLYHDLGTCSLQLNHAQAASQFESAIEHSLESLSLRKDDPGTLRNLVKHYGNLGFFLRASDPDKSLAAFTRGVHYSERLHKVRFQEEDRTLMLRLLNAQTKGLIRLGERGQELESRLRRLELMFEGLERGQSEFTAQKINYELDHWLRRSVVESFPGMGPWLERLSKLDSEKFDLREQSKKSLTNLENQIADESDPELERRIAQIRARILEEK